MAKTDTRVAQVRTAAQQTGRGRVSAMAETMIGSEILKIASDIHAMVADGKVVCNLTVGDFSPSEFKIPRYLEENIIEALQRGETNYPPSDGMLPLKKSILQFYERWLELKYPLESVLVTGGSRPVSTERTERWLIRVTLLYIRSRRGTTITTVIRLVQRGSRLCAMQKTHFFQRENFLSRIRGARLLALNSPLNPTGTAFTKDALTEICDMVLEENARRGSNERPLFLMYDQVYWMLTFGGTVHFNPVSLRPDLADYTIFVDGISKPFAATGVRVGWVVGPTDVVQKMSSIIGHVGAWAPRAEQVAVAKLLSATDEIKAYHREMKGGLQARLDSLYKGILAMRKEGLPADAITPMGAIYLTARFALNGKNTASGQTLVTNEDVRKYLLQEAGVAVVPFQAFGMKEESGWFRLSVGAVSLDEIDAMLPRLKRALSLQ